LPNRDFVVNHCSHCPGTLFKLIAGFTVLYTLALLYSLGSGDEYLHRLVKSRAFLQGDFTPNPFDEYQYETSFLPQQRHSADYMYTYPAAWDHLSTGLNMNLGTEIRSEKENWDKLCLHPATKCVQISHNKPLTDRTLKLISGAVRTRQ